MRDQGSDTTEAAPSPTAEPSAAMLRSILDEQLELVCRFAVDGRILYVNPAYASLGGATPATLIGQDFWRFIPAEERTNVEGLLKGLTPDNPTVIVENSFVGPSGVIWTRWRNHAVEFDGDGRWTVAQATGIDITRERAAEDALKASEAHLRLMVDELNHRVKNMLAMIQALAAQTISDRADRESLVSRLMSISRVQSMLTARSWAGADLAEIMTDVSRMAEAARFELDGPSVDLPPRTAVALSVALHELYTNAAKYGALAAADGRVSVRWRLDPASRAFELEWRETGGPPVTPPTRRGFGSRLIEAGLSREFEGRAAIGFHPEGVVCRITGRLPTQQEPSGGQPL